LQDGHQEETRAQAALTGLREKLARLNAPEALIGEKETIEALHRAVGVVQEASRDVVTVGAKARTQQMRAKDILATIRPKLPFEEAETLRPLKSLRTRVTELAKERGPLATALKIAEEGIPEARGKVEDAEKELAETSERLHPKALTLAIARAQKAGDLDEEIEKARGLFQDQARKVRAEIARLQPRPRDEAFLDALQELPVPFAETVQRIEGEWAKITTRQDTLAEEQKKRRTDLRTCLDEIETLLCGGKVPTEEDVLRARCRRDAGWQHVLTAWSGNEAPSTVREEFAPGQPLSDAYEESVHSADELSDQLRREADRVLRYTSLKTEQKKLEEAAAEAKEEEDEIDRKLDDLREEWLALWEPCAITPLPPRDMRTWLLNFEVVKTHHAALEETKSEGVRLRERRDALVAELLQEMKAEGSTPPEGAILLSDAMGCALDLLTSIRKEIDGREETEESLPDLREELREQREKAAAASKELEGWRKRWANAMGQLGLQDDASDAEVTVFLDQLDRCFQALDAAKVDTDRVDEMTRYTETFAKRVREFCQGIAPDLVEQPPVAAALELNQRFLQAEKEKSLRDSHRADIDENEKALATAQTDVEVATKALEALCKEAGCGASEDLADAEERSTRVRAAKTRLEVVENEIERLAFGTDREAFERTASETDPNALPGQIEELASSIEDFEKKIHAQHELVWDEQRAFQQMDGRAQAALAAQDVQGAREEIRAAAEHYVEVALAARMLRDQIELFREAHEDPILRRAGEYFGQITRGRYERLRAGYGEKDERVLFGVRPDGSRVPVEAMSDGARDQVYLALRLASLEQHAAKSEPLPFVVDDVLVHFDD
ncbi:MAG: hypothetical protein HY900_14330, partial [Deltaproteobacteria bacterium]|nr:hypothetical protein [Deltaproteobacteria bacterium]